MVEEEEETGATGMNPITMMMPLIGGGHGKAALAARADIELLHKDMSSAGPISHSALLSLEHDDEDVAVPDAAVLHARSIEDTFMVVRAPSITMHEHHLSDEQQQRQGEEEDIHGNNTSNNDTNKSFHDHFIQSDATTSAAPMNFHSPPRPPRHHEQQHLSFGDFVSVFHW